MSDIRALLVTWQDASGLVRSRLVPAAKQDAVYGSGISVGRAAATLLTLDDGVATVPGVDPLAGDLRAVADKDRTVLLDAKTGLAWAPLTLVERDGTSAVACTRSTLQRLVDKAHEDHSLQFVTGVELEFTVLRAPNGENPGREYAHDGPAYSARATIDLEPFVLDLMSNLESAGIAIDCVHPEFARGQLEVVLSPQDPVRTADNVVLAKLVIDRTARAHGLQPSFAPLVSEDMAGNGCHTHVSATGPGGNVFSNPDAPGTMTNQAEHITAGILDLLEEGVALLAGNTTSYSRLAPGRWAGGMICWGVRNREAALRYLPSAGIADAHAANVELKTPDAMSNHYLAAAFILGAALRGIDQRMSLPEPVAGDPALLDEKERQRHLVRMFPANLEKAIKLLDSSHALRKVLGDELIDIYSAVRTAEWERHRDESVADQIAATLLKY